MKKILLLAVTALFAFITMNAQNQPQKKNAKNETQVTYAVELDCPSCVKKLENSLPYIKGVKDLKVSMDDQQVWFKYDSTKTNKDILAKELLKLGYDSKEVDPNVKK